MDRVLNVYGIIENMGLGLEIYEILLVLIIINVITALFLVDGLNRKYSGIKLINDSVSISSIIILTQLLLLSAFVLFAHNSIGRCYFEIGSGSSSTINTEAPSPLHITDSILFIIACSSWIWLFPKWSSLSTCCGWASIIAFSFFSILSFRSFVIWKYVMSMCYAICQLLIPLILCNITWKRTKSFLALLTVFGAIWTYALYRVVEFDLKIGHSLCLYFGGLIWLNPLFVITNIYLLRTPFWSLAVFHNVILAIISSFDLVLINTNLGSSFCSSILNIQCIVLSLTIPIYIILLFRSIPTLKQWTMSLVGIYLVAFEVFSDFVVIYYFIDEKQVILVVLQIAFIVFGQVIGAVADAFGRHRDELSVTDKVMASVGFARIWFTIKWWAEIAVNGESGKYGALRRKHKIWNLMYESFPSIALQIYAALTTDLPPATLIASIIFSTVSVSFTMIRSLAPLSGPKNLKFANRAKSASVSGASNASAHCGPPTPSGSKNGDIEEHRPEHGDDGAQPSNGTAKTAGDSQTVPDPAAKEHGDPVSDPIVMLNRWHCLILYLFAMSDFYVRSVPLIVFVSMFSEHEYERMVLGLTELIVIAIFELVANWLILNKVTISVLSSVYTMLSILGILPIDVPSDQFAALKNYAAEHVFRCLVSAMFCIVILFMEIGYDPSKRIAVQISTAFFLVFLVINGISMFSIFRWKQQTLTVNKETSQNENGAEMTPSESVMCSL